MGVNAPVSAAAMGGFFAFEKTNIDWPDTFDAVLQYPAGPVAKRGFVVQYTFRAGCRRDHALDPRVPRAVEAGSLTQ